MFLKRDLIKPLIVGFLKLFNRMSSDCALSGSQSALRWLTIRPIKNYTIVMWEHSAAHRPVSYTLYRGQTDRWENAVAVPGPVFGTTNAHRRTIHYRLVDNAIAGSNVVYYWISCESASSALYGPYAAHKSRVSEFVPQESVCRATTT